MLMYIIILATFVTVYLYLLSVRLSSPHPKAQPQTVSTADLDSVKYDAVDMRNGIPTEPTNKTYAIIGGSGFLGTFIVQLLLLRGESRILIVDICPPQPSIASHPSVTFIRTDITSLLSVRESLTSSNHPSVDVIYFTAAIIRFWERSSYSWPLSYNVNVRGVENVLNVVKEMGKDIALVYTSSAETAIPRSNFFRLGSDLNTPPWDTVTINDHDPPLTPSQASEGCYARSKAMAERLVASAHGQSGLKTGILRPGYTILGPNDRLVTSTLVMGVVPEWDSQSSHTDVCVWDVAAAHLLLEDALTKRPEEVGGEAFLISGERQAWKVGDIRRAVKHYASKPISLPSIPPLPIFILMHAIEIFLFCRFYFLLPLHLVFFRSRPSVSPKWMGELIYLQPLTMGLMRSDIVIDDSKARKVLGYRPQWTTAQCIKYTVDEFHAGRADGHGLKLKV